MNLNARILLFEMIIGITAIVLLMLIGLFIYVSRKKENSSGSDEILDLNTGKKQKTPDAPGSEIGRFQGVLDVDSIDNFMEFDEIVDNMIVRKNRSQYVMVIQCNGVNYDLMSEEEKMSVEEGFVQFLNTLRYPIQLYVQSRTLNLKSIIDEYKERVLNTVEELKKIDQKIRQARLAGNRAMLEKLEFERRRKNSVLEYGQNITEYVERLSSNRNILQQKTYVVISYYTVEIGGNLDNYSKEELNNICFSELYTRAENVISTLGSAQVVGRILDSEELAELLFVAYNRDDSEMVQINRMLDAQYDALYSTGKDVLEKRKEKLDEEISIAAIDLTTDSILKADKRRQEEEEQKEREKNQKIKDKAINLLNQYEDQLDPRVFEIATEEINNLDTKKKTAANEKKSEEKQKPEEKSEKQTIKTTAKTGIATRRVVKRKTDTED